jgi:hypothetical protein
MPADKFLAHSGPAMDERGDRLGKGDTGSTSIPGDWPRIYVAVLCYLFLLIAGLYAMTRLFAY